MDQENQTGDGQLDAPQTWKAPTRTNITTSIDRNIWELAKQNNISWSEALEFGVRFLFADRSGVDWPECALQEKLHKMVKHRNALLTEVTGLREQVPEIIEDEENLKKEIDQVFGEVKQDDRK